MRRAGLAAIPLGMVFIVAGIGKLLLGYDAYTSSSFVFQGLVRVITIPLAYVELTIGSLLILGVAIRFVASLSIPLISGFAVFNISLIILGEEACASCFGAIGSFAPTYALILDGLMAMLVAIIIFGYPGKVLDIKPWYLSKKAQYV